MYTWVYNLDAAGCGAGGVYGLDKVLGECKKSNKKREPSGKVLITTPAAILT